MAISRYAFVNKYNRSNNVFYATARYNVRISKAIHNGTLDFKVHILADGERLDQLAYKFYNDSSYWWVIAAASNIGWGLQVPPGTIIRIPSSLSDALGVSS